MPNAYYTCHLLPLGLLTACGFTPRWLGSRLPDPAAPARRDALSVHPTTCPYVTRMVAAADELFAEGTGDEVLIVPGGCDAMRRLGDLLAASNPEHVFVLSLPRASAERDVKALAAELARLERWLGEKAASAPSVAEVADAGAAVADTAFPSATLPDVPFDYPVPCRPGGVFVVGGPLSDDSLLRLLGDLGARVSGVESCTSPDRTKPLRLAGGVSVAAVGERFAPEFDDLETGDPLRPSSRHLDLARQVLASGLCPRFSTPERRDHLARRLDEARPSSLIYARQSFCDPGAYDALLVAELAKERGLPFLEIEVGFPLEAGGPLRTRVEAFLEAQLLDEGLLDIDFDLEPAGAGLDGDLFDDPSPQRE